MRSRNFTYVSVVFRFSRRLEVFQDLSLPIPTRDEMLALKTSEKFENAETPVPANWISWVWDWFKSFFIGPTPSLEDCFSAFFSSDELKGMICYATLGKLELEIRLIYT